MNAERRSGPAASCLDAPPILFKKRSEPASRSHGTVGCLGHTLEKECNPRLPIPVFPNRVEKATILTPVLLEIKTQIQQRLTQDTGVAQLKRDQKPSDAAIAVEKRVDSLKLNMRKRSLDEDRQAACVSVDKAFESRDAVRDVCMWRRNEDSFPWPAASNPILTATKLAWILLAATTTGETFWSFVSLSGLAPCEHSCSPQERLECRE